MSFCSLLVGCFRSWFFQRFLVAPLHLPSISDVERVVIFEARNLRSLSHPSSEKHFHDIVSNNPHSIPYHPSLPCFVAVVHGKHYCFHIHPVRSLRKNDGMGPEETSQKAIRETSRLLHPG